MYIWTDVFYRKGKIMIEITISEATDIIRETLKNASPTPLNYDVLPPIMQSQSLQAVLAITAEMQRMGYTIQRPSSDANNIELIVLRSKLARAVSILRQTHKDLSATQYGFGNNLFTDVTSYIGKFLESFDASEK